jgi:hypothetical protein
MRIDKLLLAASAAALIAATAAAQDSAPPADPPAKAEAPPASGLSDLQETVQGLQDEAAPPAEAPPPPAETPPAETPPAETPPAPPAETPAPPPPPPPPAPVRPRASGPLVPLTRAERAALETATARGRLLGAIAAAGQVATRDMLSRVANPDGVGIAGWIAEPEGNGIGVTFYAEGTPGPAAVYRVSIMGGRVVGREIFLTGARPPLNPIQARMAAAGAATAGLDHQVCGGQDFNALVVPPATADGTIDVYQISPQSARGHYPVGGHYKTTVAADGTIAASRGFTNACLDVAVADPAPGAQPAPIAVTHLLDPLPTEVHVFLAIWTGHPLVVVSGDPQRLFAVTPEGIAEIPREAGR